MIKPGRKIRVIPRFNLRESASTVSKITKSHKVLFALLVLLLPTQLGKHFWPPWSYVYGLRIDYLSPTLYLTDILVVGILVLWGIEEFKNLEIYSFKNLKKFLFPASIFLFLIVNCLLAQNQAVAFSKLTKIIEFILLGWYIAKKFSIPTRPAGGSQFFNFSILLSLAIIYSSLIAIAQFIRQASLGGIFWWLGERTFSLSTPGIAKAIVGGRLLMRPYATFPHPNVLAGFLVVSFILTFPFLFEKRKPLALGYSLLAISAILISFSRSTWLIGLAVGLYWFLFYFLRQKKKCFAIAGLTGYWLLVTGYLSRLPFSTKEAVTQRLDLAQAAIAMIKKSPLIGVGLNNFLVRLPDIWQEPETIRFLQPVHNIFLLVAAETGLVGLAIFLWFVFLTCKKLLITHYSLLITALSSILLLGLFDHYWLTLQQTQLLLTIVLGLSWEAEKG